MREREKGSVSIYAAISFTCIISLILTLIEAGRYESSGANLSIVTRSAIESSMGDYANELLEEYGLFLDAESDEEFQKKVNDYISANVGGFCDDESIDMLSVDGFSVNDLKLEHITDAGGSYMAKEVSDYMKVKIGEDAANVLIDQYGNSSSIGSISKFIKSVKSAKKKLERIADAASDLYDSYEKIKKTADGIKKDIKGIKKAIKNMRETIDDYKDGECEFEDLSTAYNILVGQVDNLKQDLSNISSYGNTASEKKTEYEEGKEESKDIYKEVWADGNVEEGEDELLDNYDDVKDIVEVIDGIDLSDFDKTKKLAEENAVKIIEKQIDKLTESMELSKTIKSMSENIILNDISGNPDKSIGKKNGYGVSGKDIVKFVENMGEDVFLGQVVDVSKVSNLRVEKDEECPTNIKDKGSGKISKIDEALFSLYCADEYASYLNGKMDSPLSYEMEYILCGESSDKDNLSGTVARLLALREATNVVAILSNPDMLNEARTLALSTFGLTGIPAVVLLGEVLIVASWGYAESVVDVRTLLSGGRCKLIKKSSDFSLALCNIGSIINGSFNVCESEGKTILDGLNYKEFIQVMLMGVSKTNKYYRAMDLIEINTRKKKADFRMSKCIVKASLDVEYGLKPLFISKKVTEKFMEGGMVKIKRKTQYSY